MKIRDIRVRENSQFQDDMSFFGKVKYIFHFVTQAFLYAIFVFFIVFGLFMTVYFGDLLYNISHGNGKLPLFDAYVIVSPSMVPTIKIVEEGRVYGKVILKIPQLGKVRRFLTTSYGFLFGIIVPALAIIVFDILKLFRKKDKNIVEEEELEII